MTCTPGLVSERVELGKEPGKLLDNWIFSTVNLFPNKPWFVCVCSKSLLKTLWKKEKFFVTSNFSFFKHFLTCQRIFSHFHQIQNCRLQSISVWKNRKIVIWERVKFTVKYVLWHFCIMFSYTNLPVSRMLLSSLKMAFEIVVGTGEKCCYPGVPSCHG